MPKWMTAAFALFLSLQVFSTKGETVDDVINKYMNAMGGREHLGSIKTVYKVGFAEGQEGKKIITVTRKAQDDLFPLADYISKGQKTELLGKEKILGTYCYKVALTVKPDLIVNYFIDGENWYIVREIHMKLAGNSWVSELTIDYADFRKNKEGFIFPYKESTGIFPFIINYKTIEVNKAVFNQLY